MQFSQLKSYYDKANVELEMFRPMQNDIYRHVIPSRNSWNGVNHANVVGSRTDLHIYNSYPQVAAKNFSASLVTLTIPSGSRFFNIAPLKMADEDKDFIRKVEPISDEILNHLNSSNFYQTVTESFLDLTAGTGGFSINFDEDNNKLFFTSLDMSTVSFLEDHTGRINYIFRRLGMMDKCAQQLLLPDINFDNENIDLVECVYPHDNKFRYIITDTAFSKVYKESISDTNPFVIFRWSKRSGENRGRGILNDLIGLIKMTNIMAKNVLDASALVISPPIVTNNGALMNPNNVKIQPNAIITLDNASSMFKPFPTSPNLPFAYQEIASNNAIIDNAFMTNILGAVGNKELTATEVNARMQLAGNILGAAYNRLQREMLTPMFDRVIELLEKHGEITPITINTSTGTKRKLKLSYSSPIIDADKTIQAQKLMQAIQYTAQVTGAQAQMYISSAFKLELIPNYVANAFGAKMDLVNTPDETANNIKAITTAKAQQQQQMNNQALQAPINTGTFQGA